MNHKVQEDQVEAESAAHDNIGFIRFVNNYIYFSLYLNEFVVIYENKTKLSFLRWSICVFSII